MIKKHLIFSVMLLLMAVFNANASTWKMHNYYVSSKMQNVYDAGDKVYYLNSNHLFCYHKDTGITEALNKQNVLSDNRIFPALVRLGEQVALCGLYQLQY